MSAPSHDSSQRDHTVPRLIAGLFACLGIGMLLALTVNVGGAPNIIRARETGDIGALYHGCRRRRQPRPPDIARR